MASSSRCVRRAGSGCTPRRTRGGSAGCGPTSPAGFRPPRRRRPCSGRTVDARQPLVVLAATLPGTLEPLTAQLTVLARRAPLALAGPGAAPRLAAAVQACLLGGDPVTAAENVRWPR